MDKKEEEKSTGEVLSDLFQLCKDYAKQETIDPLKSIGRFLGLGMAGAVLLGLGLFFGALALLRGLQTETGAHLTGSYTWVPYLAALIATALCAALAVRAIKKPVRADEKDS